MNCVERPVNFLLPSSDDYLTLWYFLCGRQIPCQRAEYEAEALATYMCKNHPDAIVITEDSDVLMYECPRTIFKYGSEKQVFVEYSRILEELQITSKQFKNLCILLGNDFNERIPGVGPVKSFQLIQECKEDDLFTMLQNQPNKKVFTPTTIEKFKDEYTITNNIILTCCYEKKI